MITGKPTLAANSRASWRLEMVADAGHSVYFEQPAAFNDAVLTFLRDLEAAEGAA